MYSTESQLMFQSNMLALLATCLTYSSTLKIEVTCFYETSADLQLMFQRNMLALLATCLTYSSTLKDEATSFYETSADFQRTDLIPPTPLWA
jgi:hypothetical protein